MSKGKERTRRAFLRDCGRYAVLGALSLAGITLFGRRRRLPCGGAAACAGCPVTATCPDSSLWTPRRASADGLVWQLDPAKCVQCGRCETECVLKPSAVKCVHRFGICGYCQLCFGYFRPKAPALTTGAENQTCPTGALRRRFIEEPYYEYTIDESLCIGCGKCVKGCNTFGNGSLTLQVRHDRCLNCNECAIARACPSGAYRRVPARHPYLLKGGESA